MPEQNLTPTLWELMGMMEGAGMGGGLEGMGGGAGGGDLNQYLMGLLGKSGLYKGDDTTGAVLSGTGGFDPGALKMEMTPMEWREEVDIPAKWVGGRLVSTGSEIPEGFYAGEKQYKDVTDLGELSGLMGREGFGSMGEDKLREEISKLFGGQVTGYEGQTVLSPEEEALEQLEGRGGEDYYGAQQAFTDVGFTESSMDELISMMQAVQEGKSSLAGKEKKFGLGKRLGRAEKGAERATESAYQGYVPRETQSRYRGVQRGGDSIANQMAEADYLAKQSATQRKAGRGARDIFGDYKGELYGGVQRWLQNLL